jgi:hypothetical protein
MMGTDMTEDIHSCSYFCTRPACVLAQRDEMRAELARLREQKPAAHMYPSVLEKFQTSETFATAPPAQPDDLIPQDALFVCGQMGAHVTRVRAFADGIAGCGAAACGEEGGLTKDE